MFHYEKAWQDVVARIGRAARACGRDPAGVRLVAVSKTFPAEAIRAVHALGQRDFGENYVQEAAAKMASLSDLADIEWHLIGPLQSNKAAIAASRFAWVQTVDRAKIAARLAAARPGRHAAAFRLHTGQCERRGVEERRDAGGGGRPRAGRRRAAPVEVARNHGHSRANRRRRSGVGHNSGSCAIASMNAGRRACRWTRCRWGCRPTSRTPSPRARRWCAWEPRSSGRGDESRSGNEPPGALTDGCQGSQQTWQLRSSAAATWRPRSSAGCSRGEPPSTSFGWWSRWRRRGRGSPRAFPASPSSAKARAKPWPARRSSSSR